MLIRSTFLSCFYLVCLTALVCRPMAASALPSETQIESLVRERNLEEIKRQGQDVLPVLLELYKKGDISLRTNIAATLYGLSWKSEEAKELLMRDVHTEDRDLRLQVQWALGRVSNDDSVVHTLLDNMRNDKNPLFRDKAACALTYDQIHLTEQQQAILYAGLIDALDDEKPDVRYIAALSLQLRTGQSKGYNSEAPWPIRKVAIMRWRWWLDEFKANIQSE